MNRRTLHQYKLRLTNLSQSNRSLKLGRLSRHKDLDLTVASQAHKMTAGEMLSRIVAGRSVDLITTLSARDEKVNLLDRHLTRLYRQTETLYEETGSDDLFLGYPFVEGKFLNGAVARCPILLFPIRLVRNLSGKPRWRLEVPKGESIQFNRTFFLAYEKFQQVRLPRSFWEEEIDHQPDLQTLLNRLYEFLKQYDLALNFNSDLFQFEVVHFPDKLKMNLEALEVGKLKFYPHAVMGVFPQSDSALVRDYDFLEQEEEQFELDKFLQVREPEKVSKYIPENQRYFVTPVDQSQEEALLAVKNGQSVVVHGPPGTGKSQVILNLIADALARGQRVLVCSQKRAALDVVYHRLSELGLGRFAALVHDYRGDRSKIFEKIRKQIDSIEDYKRETKDLGQSKWERDFRLDARKIDEYSTFFEGLHTALTDSERFGITAHQLYLVAQADMEPFPIKELARKFNYPALVRLMENFERVLDYAEFYEAAHPWSYRLSFARYGLEDRGRLLKKAGDLAGELEELADHLENIELIPDLPVRAEALKPILKARQELMVRLGAAQREDLGWIMKDGLKKAYMHRKLGSLRKIIDSLKTFKVLGDFNRVNFYDLHRHVTHYKEYQGKFGRLFSLNYLKARWYLQAILQEKSLKLNDENFRLLNREFRVLERLVDHAKSFTGQDFFDDLPLTDTVDKLDTWYKRKQASFDLWCDFQSVTEWKVIQPRLDASGKQLDEEHLILCEETLTLIEVYTGKINDLLPKWREWLHESQIEQLYASLRTPDRGKEMVEVWRSSLADDFEELRSLDRFLLELEPREKALLGALRNEIGKGDEFLDELRNSIYLFWIEILEEEKPELGEVSARMMVRRIDAFQEKVGDRQEKVIQLILRKLKDEIIGNIEYNRLGNPVTYRQIGHQVRKKRLLWSVRRLIRETWSEGLSRLLPCWLASPESVSAVFPMEKDFFDLVIFDEASQCYVERALPVMLRGRNCVIAGDDKQLPPFDLYNVKIDEDENEIDQGGMAMEVESALDLARSIFTEIRLSWHYRSREEELINFSNHAFYDGRLNVIPSAVIQSQPPIDFIRVNGVWEKNSNLVEAKRVLEEVERLIQDPKAPTIGIVTFNFQQKELIRDLLEARMGELSREGDTELLKLYHHAMYREEEEERQGIFIKNIENVQGDERDVIIFSVAYARNAAGKMVSNFGLLNQKGGENRLNVAITRARKQVILVCSFDPVDLKVEQSLNPGPKLFKKYLRYAEAVHGSNEVLVDSILGGMSGQGDQSEGADATPGLELAEQVAADLEALGYKVERNIGDTNYKLDLAVVSPAGGYILGIECEGENYFNGKSSKEREVYRRKLLAYRDWKIYRVWARNYFLDKEKEIGKIHKLIQDTNK